MGEVLRDRQQEVREAMSKFKDAGLPQISEGKLACARDYFRRCKRAAARTRALLRRLFQAINVKRSAIY